MDYGANVFYVNKLGNSVFEFAKTVLKVTTNEAMRRVCEEIIERFPTTLLIVFKHRKLANCSFKRVTEGILREIAKY